MDDNYHQQWGGGGGIRKESSPYYTEKIITVAFCLIELLQQRLSLGSGYTRQASSTTDYE